MYSVTLSLSRNLPCSNSFISDDVVATTLVSEAQSKIVSTVMVSGVRHQRPLAVRLAVDHLAVVPDQQHRAGQASLLDRQVDGGIHGGTAREGLRGQSGGGQGGAPKELHVRRVTRAA